VLSVLSLKSILSIAINIRIQTIQTLANLQHNQISKHLTL